MTTPSITYSTSTAATAATFAPLKAAQHNRTLPSQFSIKPNSSDKVSHWHDWSLYWVTSTEAQPRQQTFDRRKLPRLDDEETDGEMNDMVD
jgi:hypothetical protein